MFLIVGLGNPGREYARTRHNLGFMIVDYLAQLAAGVDSPSLDSSSGWGFKKWRQAEVLVLPRGGRGLGKSGVILAKPLTYMNLSGEAVQALFSFYKIALTDLLVLHDDLDFPLGTMKLKPGGGHGGHNGLRSLFSHLGSEFARLRCGIGKPVVQSVTNKSAQVSDYVLAPFTKDELLIVTEVCRRAAKVVECLLTQDLAAAMRLANTEV